jgi:hypothetical protein
VPPKTHNSFNYKILLRNFEDIRKFENKSKKSSKLSPKEQIAFKSFKILVINIRNLENAPFGITPEPEWEEDFFQKSKKEMIDTLILIREKFHTILKDDPRYVRLLKDTDELVAKSIIKINNFYIATDVTVSTPSPELTASATASMAVSSLDSSSTNESKESKAPKSNEVKADHILTATKQESSHLTRDVTCATEPIDEKTILQPILKVNRHTIYKELNRLNILFIEKAELINLSSLNEREKSLIEVEMCLISIDFFNNKFLAESNRMDTNYYHIEATLIGKKIKSQMLEDNNNGITLGAELRDRRAYLNNLINHEQSSIASMFEEALSHESKKKSPLVFDHSTAASSALERSNTHLERLVTSRETKSAAVAPKFLVYFDFDLIFERSLLLKLRARRKDKDFNATSVFNELFKDSDLRNTDGILEIFKITDHFKGKIVISSKIFHQLIEPILVKLELNKFRELVHIAPELTTQTTCIKGFINYFKIADKSKVLFISHNNIKEPHRISTIGITVIKAYDGNDHYIKETIDQICKAYFPVEKDDKKSFTRV